MFYDLYIKGYSGVMVGQQLILLEVFGSIIPQLKQ
jgi:hypothetical protein